MKWLGDIVFIVVILLGACGAFLGGTIAIHEARIYISNEKSLAQCLDDLSEVEFQTLSVPEEELEQCWDGQEDLTKELRAWKKDYRKLNYKFQDLKSDYYQLKKKRKK